MSARGTMYANRTSVRQYAKYPRWLLAGPPFVAAPARALSIG